MQKNRNLAFLGAALIAGGLATSPVLAQSTTPPAVQAEKQATQQRALTAASYVTYASNADYFEIEAAKIAIQRAQNKEVREFAKQLVDEHARSSTKLTAAARQSGVTPTQPMLTAKMKTKLDELQTTSLSNFDRLYIMTQLDAHERALRLHNSYAMNGDQPALRTASTEAVPMVRHHLSEAKRISGVIANERGGAS